MSSNQEYLCYECSRKYPDFNKYQTHIKLKHRESKALQKSSIRDEELSELEDKIYTFLGELSEMYSEHARIGQPQNLLQEQRFIGQANYSTNLIVRTPYQQQIDVASQIPKNYKFIPFCLMVMKEQQINQIVEQISSEIVLLSKHLNQQRNYWEFADPKDTTVDFDNQFSILNIPKLIKNYPKRNISLHMPYVTIFLTWIGRICKPDMFKVIYQMVVSDIICYENYQCLQKLQKDSKRKLKSWQGFVQRSKQLSSIHKDSDKCDKKDLPNEQSQITYKLKCFELNLNVNNIEISKLQKLLQFYEMWVDIILHSLLDKKNFQGYIFQPKKISTATIN